VSCFTDRAQLADQLDDAYREICRVCQRPARRAVSVDGDLGALPKRFADESPPGRRRIRPLTCAEGGAQ
jgi:hypothetical protein